MMNRRNFLKQTGAAGLGAISIPTIVSGALTSCATTTYAPVVLTGGETILFQGDSITDCGRSRQEENNANNQAMLGQGYAMLASARILADNAGKDIQIFNRGIGGNRVHNLAERWQRDCFDLKPDLLSIHIGVNDFWHIRDFGYDGTLEKYDTDYRNLIDRTREALPGTKLIICEPFLIHGGRVIKDDWEAEFDGYRQAAKAIAADHKLIFVPWQTVFNEALKQAPAAYWGEDGVHPSLAGAQLMAEAWQKAVFK